MEISDTNMVVLPLPFVTLYTFEQNNKVWYASDPFVAFKCVSARLQRLGILDVGIARKRTIQLLRDVARRLVPDTMEVYLRSCVVCMGLLPLKSSTKPTKGSLELGFFTYDEPLEGKGEEYLGILEAAVLTTKYRCAISS
jgi:hypothetical protein